MPPREPDYRRNRPHETFLANLPATVAALKRALVTAWQAQPATHDWPRHRVTRAVAERYSQEAWNTGRE